MKYMPTGMKIRLVIMTLILDIIFPLVDVYPISYYSLNHKDDISHRLERYKANLLYSVMAL